MDPLSIVASTITIASVAAALVKSLEKLIRLRGASSELLSLMNDVTDLNAVLQEFGTCVKDDQKRLTLSLDYQADLLQRGKNTLLELDSIVHYELIKPGPGEIRVSHKNWLRKCSSIKRLQEDIKDIKINLLLVSGSITL